MLRNEEGYTDPTADKVFSSVLKKPTLSEQDAKSLSRHLNARDLVERSFYEDAAYVDRIYKEIGTEVIESRIGTKRM